METSLDGHGHITGVECAPLPEADLHGLDGETDTALAALGLPPRPLGRLWLLRPVGPFATVAEVLAHLDATAAARGTDPGLTTEFLTLAGAELATLGGPPPPGA